MHRVFGLVIDGNGLASDAFPDVGPHLAFLGAAHTMANFETANYESLPCDTSPHQSPHFKQTPSGIPGAVHVRAVLALDLRLVLQAAGGLHLPVA